MSYKTSFGAYADHMHSFCKKAGGVLRFVWKIRSIQFTSRLLLVNTGASLTLISFNSTYIWLNVVLLMEIFERFGYMRSIFKCELSCGLELKGDYSLRLITKLASCFFQLSCLSTTANPLPLRSRVDSPDPLQSSVDTLFTFLCGSQRS